MKPMHEYFQGCQHLHGEPAAAESHCRLGRCCTTSRRGAQPACAANDGWRSPAERLNQHRYHENWLHNLLVSASLAGYRHRITLPRIRYDQGICKESTIYATSSESAWNA